MGSCETLTKEAVANAIRNRGLIFQKDPSLTQEQIWSQLSKVHEAHSNVNEKYLLFGVIPVKRRVSEVAKRRFGLRFSSATHDQEVGREGGTYVHEVMAKLIDFHYNNIGNLEKIKKDAMNGEFKLREDDFYELNNLAVSLLEQIQEQQMEIDPEGTAIVKPEMFVLNPKTNTGGTIDLFALFSDGTSSIYDYKTRRPYDKDDGNVITSSGLNLMSDLLTYSNTRSYDLAMQTYKEILTEANNVKTIRQNRLVPILVAYRGLPLEETNKVMGKTIKKELIAIRAGKETSEFLSQLPVQTETSRFEGLNKLLNRQISEITRLLKLANSKNITKEERDKLLARIKTIQAGVKNTRLEEDLTSTIDDVTNLLTNINTTLKQPEFDSDNNKNTLYPNLRDLVQLKTELSVYNKILDESHSYFKDLKDRDIKAFNKQYNRLRSLVGAITDNNDELKRRIESEVLKNISDVFKKPTGSLEDIPELNWIEGRTLHMSEIDHPLFKEAWKLIQKQQRQTKVKFKELDKEVWAKTEAVFRWAKENHMYKMDALKLLVDPNTGNMISVINKEFSLKLAKLFTQQPDQDFEAKYKELRSYYDFIDKEEWKKDYVIKLTNFKAKMFASLNNLEPLYNEDKTLNKSKKDLEKSYKKAVQDFIDNNDLEHSREAWFKGFNRKYIELKPEIANANYSAEYKNILNNKPLKEYYDMWKEKMAEFYNILGITDYDQLPREFIPNIRKELVEHFSSSGLHIKAAFNEILDSFNVREEDTHMTQVDENGEVIKQIPILFLNPFIDKDGKLDLERKSYDLTSSLLLFAKMVYNYKSMYEIEPHLQAMKMLMAEPSAEQGATQVTDNLGNRIRGVVQPYLTKAGMDSDTYKLFEDFADYYLYGTKFKEKSLSKKVNTTKLILDIKNKNAILKLGFAVIPAVGAYVAGKTGIYFESKKGISYTEEHWLQAQIELMTKPKKYISFVEFFDPYNDDAYERIFRGRSATAKRKFFSDRLAYWPLKTADIKIMNHITMAMAHNYGLDKEGNLIRLNRAGVDASMYTPLIDAFEILENGDVKINMKEEAFMSFRNAVMKTSQGIIGNMNPEDVSATDTSLTQNVMMQFKTWMPGVVREYTGKLRYDEDIQAMRWGRFKALADQFGIYHLTEEDMDNGTKIALFAKKVLGPELVKLTLDLVTFGAIEKWHIGGYSRVNEEKARMRYQMWLSENPEMIGKTSFEDFLEVKRGQLKASLTTMRAILGMLSLILFLKGEGDDDEPRYMENWITRTSFKVLTKAESEIAFMWTPGEFLRMLKTPFPMTQLISQAGSTIENGADEFLDYIYGENSSQDKTGAGYYLIQWIPGGSQISRLAELWPNYKKSPYAPITLR
jgi:hypothetical protein